MKKNSGSESARTLGHSCVSGATPRSWIRWCRHHVQIAGTPALGGGSLDLNREHAPSGWVTIEEMTRFLSRGASEMYSHRRTASNHERGELSRSELEALAEHSAHELLCVSADKAFAMVNRGELAGKAAEWPLLALQRS